MISQKVLEEALQEFLIKNGYVSERPVDLSLAAEEMNKSFDKKYFLLNREITIKTNPVSFEKPIANGFFH